MYQPGNDLTKEFSDCPREIAVLGAGAAGLSAAWLLSRRHRVTLYEREARVGGHINTIDVEDDSGPIPVDTGFIVYNERNYPQLTALFEHLEIETRASDMTFAVSVDDGRFEYAGSNLNTLFAQRRRLLDPAFIALVRDVLKFNSRARAFARDVDAGGAAGSAAGADGLSVGDFLDRGGYGRAFVHRYLLPMAAAIWSCPPEQMRDFPALSLFRFFDNHGLLNVNDRPMWRTVIGGARTYAQALQRDLSRSLGGEMLLGRAAVCVERRDDGVWVRDDRDERRRYDAVVIGAHADQALAMIERPTRAESATLGAFSYQANRAVLHCDPALMPVLRRTWSAWNYFGRSSGHTRPSVAASSVAVTYWMNLLQGLRCKRDYFVTLNPLEEPAPGTSIREIDYTHPVFDRTAMQAQARLPELQGVDRVWFCGSYCGYGFHEDALRSAVDVARAFGVTPPWADRREAAFVDATAPEAPRESAPAPPSSGRRGEVATAPGS